MLRYVVHSAGGRFETFNKRRAQAVAAERGGTVETIGPGYTVR